MYSELRELVQMQRELMLSMKSLSNRMDSANLRVVQVAAMIRNSLVTRDDDKLQVVPGPNCAFNLFYLLSLL